MTRKRLTQEERRQQTRADVLAAAGRVFARRGFHGASLEAIADDAGVTRGAVYYNFADKEELFLELLDRRCAERAQDLREVFADADPGEVDAASRQAQPAAQRALDAMTGDAEWRALYLEFLAHAARDPAFRRAFARRTDLMRSVLEDVVVAQTEPIVDTLPMPAEQLAVVIDALSVGLWAHHMLHGRRAVPSDLFSKALALLVEGLAAHAATPDAEGAS
jgi:AcrR family transcriptional regulator